MVIDFVVYFLAQFFERNQQKLKWNTPVQKSCYLVGLATFCLLITIVELLNFTILKEVDFMYFTKFGYIILGLLIVQLFEFIYVKKERYTKQVSKRLKFKEFDYRRGVIISWIFIFASLLLPALIYISFVPAGSGLIQ
jgi:hypothetical protein